MGEDGKETRSPAPGVSDRQESRSGPAQAVLNVLGVLLCVIFVPIIILNIVMIVRSYTDPDRMPSVLGYSPVIVLSGSMSPEFEAGDMILIRQVDPNTLQENDVICYLEREAAVTHRIMEIIELDGSTYFITQGDANNTEDSLPVTPQQVQGKYTGLHIPKLGDFAIFLQSTLGMILFIGGPILLFFLWDGVRKLLNNRKAKTEQQQAEVEAAGKQRELEAMEQELARLRAQVGEQARPEESAEQAPPEEEQQQ